MSIKRHLYPSSHTNLVEPKQNKDMYSLKWKPYHNSGIKSDFQIYEFAQGLG
jgi:hypothetical protein